MSHPRSFGAQLCQSGLLCDLLIPSTSLIRAPLPPTEIPRETPWTILGHLVPPRYLGSFPLHFIPLHSSKPICCDQRSSYFIPSPVTQSCCASVIEPSFVQSAPLISPFGSAAIGEHSPNILAVGGAPLVPPHPRW